MRRERTLEGFLGLQLRSSPDPSWLDSLGQILALRANLSLSFSGCGPFELSLGGKEQGGEGQGQTRA